LSFPEVWRLFPLWVRDGSVPVPIQVLVEKDAEQGFVLALSIDATSARRRE